MYAAYKLSAAIYSTFTCRNVSMSTRTYRPNSITLSSSLAGRRPAREQACELVRELDSVMEFGLYQPVISRRTDRKINGLFLRKTDRQNCYSCITLSILAAKKMMIDDDDEYNKDEINTFTGVSWWAETGVCSSAVDTRGSVLTCVIQTVVRQRYAVRWFVFPTYKRSSPFTLNLFFSSHRQYVIVAAAMYRTNGLNLCFLYKYPVRYKIFTLIFGQLWSDWIW